MKDMCTEGKLRSYWEVGNWMFLRLKLWTLKYYLMMSEVCAEFGWKYGKKCQLFNFKKKTLISKPLLDMHLRANFLD